MSEAADNLEKGFERVITSPLKAVSDAEDKVKGVAGKVSDTVKSWLPKQTTTIDNTGAKFEGGTPIGKPKAPSAATPKKPSFKDGTDFVPKTGDAKLHKGEAVLKKEDADKFREAKMKHGTMSSVAEELGGKSEKPKKEIKHMHNKKAAGGKGHIHVHVHTHPEVHPDEEHVRNGNDGLADHILENMGAPNPGEAEADAGQSGIPAAAAAPGAAAGATPPNAALPTGA